MNMENKLQDYVFHYNVYNELWSAIPRDRYMKYWNDIECPGIIKDVNINNLIKKIKNDN
jgi:hypothetical protein